MADIETRGSTSAMATPGHGDLIKDTTTATFMDDVVDVSRSALVLVDFWAEWCGPCKQLTPIIEKVVLAAGGAVRLVKMDIDKYPEIPGQMGVKSIPAVFAFRDGRPVDTFSGALPESEIRKFIEKHAGPDAFSGGGDTIETANAALEANDLQGAADIFSALLAEDQGNPDLLAGLARVCIKSGDLTQAESFLAEVPKDKLANGQVTAARAMLDLARQSETAGDVAPLRASVEANPDDYASRLDLAIALAAGNDREGAVNQLLEIFRRNRDWNDGAARAQLVQFFEAWGVDDPDTISGRRRLSTLLFS